MPYDGVEAATDEKCDEGIQVDITSVATRSGSEKRPARCDWVLLFFAIPSRIYFSNAGTAAARCIFGSVGCGHGIATALVRVQLEEGPK